MFTCLRPLYLYFPDTARTTFTKDRPPCHPQSQKATAETIYALESVDTGFGF